MRHLKTLTILTAMTVLAVGCSTGSRHSAKRDAEFENRVEVTDRNQQTEHRALVANLAKLLEAQSVEELLGNYTKDAYIYHIALPRTNTGTDEYRRDLGVAFPQYKNVRFTLAEDGFRMWKYSGKMWTLQAFNINATRTSDGGTTTFTGWHSAIWEKKDDKWKISYEHVTSDPKAMPAPPAPAKEDFPPAPAPKPDEVLPGIEEMNRKGYLKDIFFDFDKNNIREDQRETMAKNADWLKKNPTVKIRIEGHCDERATAQYNIALGERRAASTKEYFVSLGIDASRMETVSYGEERPFASGHDERAWAQNRRSHLVIISK